ncbi:MBL fold metallo-hydrolase [Noviherbaspirillum saxi]|nr:MBL fold metallo-hydrolase [Noviherbaspirillum saxi]
MLRYFIGFVFSLLVVTAHAQQAPRSADSAPNVGFSILKTGSLSVREGLIFSGGRFGEKVDSIFSAILVKHGQEFFLFDAGLGSKVAQQYEQDMPLFMRPFFRYEEPVSPARAQLDQAGIGPIQRIILSHSHWDHASGLSDFPDAQVLVAPEELEHIRQPSSAVAGAWPSQVGDKSIRWKTLDFKPAAYEGFERSIDLYGDGKIVLVPMYGHTPGSIGMFVTVDSGKQYFFVGDVVWSASAVQKANPKFWAARFQVDKDADKTQQTIEQIRAVVSRRPEVIVVPAHDGKVQNALGYFPSWIK